MIKSIKLSFSIQEIETAETANNLIEMNVVCQVNDLLYIVQIADRQLRNTPQRLKKTLKDQKAAEKRVATLKEQHDKVLKERSKLLALWDKKIQRGELERDGEDETTDAIKRIRVKIRNVEGKLLKWKQTELNLQAKLEKQQETLEAAQEVLASNLIGTEPTQLFASVNAVKQKAEELQRKEVEVRDALVCKTL